MASKCADTSVQLKPVHLKFSLTAKILQLYYRYWKVLILSADVIATCTGLRVKYDLHNKGPITNRLFYWCQTCSGLICHIDDWQLMLVWHDHVEATLLGTFFQVQLRACCLQPSSDMMLKYYKPKELYYLWWSVGRLQHCFGRPRSKQSNYYNPIWCVPI